jgi:hypothetical protein
MPRVRQETLPKKRAERNDKIWVQIHDGEAQKCCCFHEEITDEIKDDLGKCFSLFALYPCSLPNSYRLILSSRTNPLYNIATQTLSLEEGE